MTQPFATDKESIKKFINLTYLAGIQSNNFEEASYSLFFAIKYDVEIEDFSIDKVITSDDCILLIIVYLYCKKHRSGSDINKLKEKAKELVKDDDTFGRYWLFIYEILPQSVLRDEWKPMKEAKVSFLINETWMP